MEGLLGRAHSLTIQTQPTVLLTLFVLAAVVLMICRATLATISVKINARRQSLNTGVMVLEVAAVFGSGLTIPPATLSAVLLVVVMAVRKTAVQSVSQMQTARTFASLTYATTTACVLATANALSQVKTAM